MLKDRIDKTVYTKNADGTVEKWYLEQIIDENTAFLRKSPRPKWIDAKAIYYLSGVHETTKEALNGATSIKLQ